MSSDVDLVMLVDGLRFTVEGTIWVQYTTALKPVGSSLAYFVDPVFVSGHESAPKWQAVFRYTLPEIAPRIRALVSDGLPGLKTVAADNGWVYQRCHFHIWALFRSWLWPLAYDHNRAIHAAVSAVLTTADPEAAAAARIWLQSHIAANPGGAA